jgi:parallel beta-helix repeat protein
MAHRSDSKRYFAIIVIAALVCGLGLRMEPPRVALATSDYSAWNDLGVVFTAPSGRAYYPSVVYDANGFGSGSRLYKMWYSNGSGGVFVITSTNGLNWGTPTAVSGLHAGAHHVQVLYDASCFGTLPCDASAAKYKLWYWAGTMTYAISDLATAQSIDGITWMSDTTLTQSATAPLVTGAGVGWNRGSYGISQVFYQISASNSGTEPWNYSYVAYYDGTDGSSEVTGLAYSADGLFWTAYAGTPVLDKGNGNAWDCDDAVYGTVYHDAGGYHYWYSGGGGDNGSGGCLSGAPNNQGIGYASAPDGKAWTKSPSNPIFHISQGVNHRSQRVYTPNIVDDCSGVLKMYYSAVGDDGIYKIGLALNALTPQIVFVDDNWVGLSALTQVTFPGDPDPHFIGVDAFAAIQAGVNAVATGGTVKVAAGTYLEEVSLNKPNLKLLGAGIEQSNVMGHKDIGGASTLTFASNGSLVDGFTITRDGNNPTDWAANVKTIGVVFNQGVTNNTLQNSKVTGNRNGLYLNNTQGNTIKNNVITFNRTGFQFANNVSNNVVWQNTITDNWTMGVLFNFDDLTFQTTGITITGNDLSGNWYGDVQCRWANSKALLNLSDNWFGANTIVTSSLNSSEPGYAGQIPVAYGGTATNPGGAANIGGTCSQLVDYTPWLNVGTDISTNPGFQDDFSSLWVSAASPQTGNVGRIQEGVDRVTTGGTVNVVTGTYVENVVITQSIRRSAIPIAASVVQRSCAPAHRPPPPASWRWCKPTMSLSMI